MNKQQLVHLNKLFEQVVSHTRKQGNNLEELDVNLSDRVKASDVHKSKTDQRESLLALASAVSSEIETVREEDIGSFDFMDEQDLEEVNDNFYQLPDKFRRMVEEMDEEQAQKIYQQIEENR